MEDDSEQQMLHESDNDMEYDPSDVKFTKCWKDDGYCNGRNLPGAYIVGNTLRYQDLEWYEALKDSKLKEEALKNKVIMEGMIDEYDESSNEGWRRWDDFNNEESENEMEHEDEERCTDNAKITRKQSKPGKHGHGNGRIHKSREIAIKGQFQIDDMALRFQVLSDDSAKETSQELMIGQEGSRNDTWMQESTPRNGFLH
ncbi:hypothetical protein Tco_1486275 [Tanacetum coccineum]